MTSVSQIGLDFARPPDLGLGVGREGNAARPHFLPFPRNKLPADTERSRGEL